MNDIEFLLKLRCKYFCKRKPVFLKFFSLVFSALFFLKSTAQENFLIQYYSRTEEITVISKEEGFSSLVTYRGKTGVKPFKIQIPYHEIEKIEIQEVKYKTANGKYVKINPDMISDQAIITDGAHNRSKVKLFDLKPNIYFEYSYKVNCAELQQFSVLDFNSETKTDTFEYWLKVPKDYTLIFELPFKSDLNTTIAIDSIIGLKENSYKFKSINKRKFEYYSDYNKEYEKPLNPIPQIKLFVLPNYFLGKPYGFFNECNKNLYSFESNLSSESIAFFENVFDKISVKDSLIPAIFAQVKEKVNCVSVDNCLMLKQVKDVNKILMDKSGTCKDVSVLMYHVFKHFGFDAKLALASSASSVYDIDFPGLCCVDHVICVINHNNKWHYLDPLEPIYVPGIPPSLIQGRHIFILNENDGLRHKVELVPADCNNSKLHTVINLESNTENYSGNYQIETKGQQTISLIKGYRFIYSDNFKNGILKKFEKESSGLKFQNVNVISKRDALSLKGELLLPRKFLMKIGNRNYLSLKFLPFPHDLPLKASERSEFLTYKPLSNHYTIVLKFPKPIQLIEEENSSYNENGFEFNMRIKQTADNELTITYFYFYDNALVTNEKIKTYNKVNTYIKDLFGRMVYFDNIVSSEPLNPEIKTEKIKD